MSRTSRINLDYRRAPLRFIDVDPKTNQVNEVARLPIDTFPEQTSVVHLYDTALFRRSDLYYNDLVEEARRKILLEGLYVTHITLEDSRAHLHYRPCSTPEEEEVIRAAVAEEARIKAPLPEAEPLILNAALATQVAEAAFSGMAYLTQTYPSDVRGSHLGISRTALNGAIELSIVPFTYPEGPSHGRPGLRIRDVRRGRFLPYFNQQELHVLEVALQDRFGSIFSGIDGSNHNLMHVSAYLDVAPHPSLRQATRNHHNEHDLEPRRPRSLTPPLRWH